jgi:hypothetical protein
MRCAHWLVGACMAAAAAASNGSDLRSDHPEQYTVVREDTLWDISARFLQSPWLWPEIWQANPSIQNPHLIYPGDQVRLVYVQGQPRLVIDRNGVVKLSPKARVEPLGGAIPTLPYNVIAPYLNGNQFVALGELEAAPYVVGQRDGKILSADGAVAYVKGEAVFGLDLYGVYRKGQTLAEPVTGQPIQLPDERSGLAMVFRVFDRLSYALILEASRAMTLGDSARSP